MRHGNRGYTNLVGVICLESHSFFNRVDLILSVVGQTGIGEREHIRRGSLTLDSDGLRGGFRHAALRVADGDGRITAVQCGVRGKGVAAHLCCSAVAVGRRDHHACGVKHIAYGVVRLCGRRGDGDAFEGFCRDRGLWRDAVVRNGEGEGIRDCAIGSRSGDGEVVGSCRNLTIPVFLNDDIAESISVDTVQRNIVGM